MKNNDVFEHFLRYEFENNLFDIEYDGIKIWETLRSYLYIDIEMYYNNLQPLFPKNKKKIIKKISLNIIKNSIKIFFVKNQDMLFLNNPRRVKQDDLKYYCIYTDLLIDELKKDYSCLTFEDPFWALSPSSNVSHFEPVKTQNICYLDSMEYIFKTKKFFYKFFCKGKYRKLHRMVIDIEHKIENEFNCDLKNITMFAEDKLLYVILMKSLYEKFIRHINPKCIFEFYDVFPSKILINKIAKENAIPIVEIQHGIVTKKNPIFLKYKDCNRKYDCVPDYVLSFGEKLLCKNNMPISVKNIFYVGNSFLNYKKNQYRNVNKIKKSILFISQSNLGEKISQFASELADLLKNNDEYQIIYKMHPYEIGKNYDCLNKKNIIIVNNREKDLYYYQSISIAQVGIYSTGLYEGLYFDLPTFIIDNSFGTVEIKEILGISDGVIYINTAEELVLKLDRLNDIRCKENYWCEFNAKKIKSIIKKIIDN